MACPLDFQRVCPFALTLSFSMRHSEKSRKPAKLLDSFSEYPFALSVIDNMRHQAQVVFDQAMAGGFAALRHFFQAFFFLGRA